MVLVFLDFHVYYQPSTQTLNPLTLTHPDFPQSVTPSYALQLCSFSLHTAANPSQRTTLPQINRLKLVRSNLHGMKKDPVAVPDRQKAFAMPRRFLKYRATNITPEKIT